MSRPLTDRYIQAKRIALGAAEFADEERLAFIAREAAGDELLEREVLWMLAAIESSHTATLPGRAPESPDFSGRDTEATSPRHYRIVRRLGEGGMGAVYLAERGDEAYTQQVALKFLHASAEGSPILLERFTQERKLLARLEHPGIARLVDGGVMADGKPFLAMEFIEGERIDVWCDRHGLGLDARIALFLKVCEAVDYAHRHLIIHRDIKPANILVTEDGTPKLLDFGIARLIDGPVDVAATATAHHAMTLAYASPEQIERLPLTVAADVYSLGVVLYQLVAGRRPYQHLTTPHLLSQAIVTGDVVAPSRAAREETPPRRVPKDIDAIVLKALRRQVSERYPGVTDLAADLRRFLACRPVLARRGRRVYRMRRYLQRNRWAVLAACVACLVAVVVLVDRARYLHQVEDARNRAQALSAFMTGLFKDAAPEQDRGERITVREVLDRGVDRLLAQKAMDAGTKAGMLRALGDTYLSLHMFTRADRPLLAARDLLDASGGSLDERVDIRRSLALSAAQDGDNARSLRYVREGLALLKGHEQDHFAPWIHLRVLELDDLNNGSMLSPQELEPRSRALIAAIERHGPADLQPDLSEAYSALAVEIERAGDLDRALEAARKAAALSLSGGTDINDQMVQRSNLARMLIVHGDYQEAERALRALDRDYVKFIGPATMSRALLLNNLAVVLVHLKRTAEAADVGARVVDIALRSGGRDNRFYLQLAANQAMRLINVRRYGEAEGLLRSIMPVLASTAASANGAANYAFGLSVLGRAQLLGDKDPAAALSSLDQAVRVLGDHAADFLVIYNTIVSTMVSADLQLKRTDAAAQAVSRYEALLDASHEPADSSWRKNAARLRASLDQPASGRSDGGT